MPLRVAVSFVYLPGIWTLLAHITPVVTDPEDPRFDLEKLVSSWEAQS